MKNTLSPEEHAELMDGLLEKLKNCPVYDIAAIVRRNWKPVNYAAKPYLEAMESLVNVHDNFGADSGKSIVRYFLSNATSWRGPVAKAVKAELNKRIK